MSDPKRVLVAEETKTTREMVTFLLANRGYEVTEVSSGKAALDSVAALSPDLVVLSADLSDLSGYDVFSRLRSRRESARLPILLLVAFTDTVSAPTRTLPSPEFLISKPFTAHDFLQRVGKVFSALPEPSRP